MRIVGFLALALSLAVPAVAQAQDGVKLDCVMASVTPDLQASLGTSMMGGAEDPRRDEMKGKVRALTDACAAKTGVDADIYFDYALARIGRQHFTAELRRRFGIDTAVVEKFFDYRPGGTNPDFTRESITQDHVTGLLASLRAAGVDVDSVGQETWEMLGLYLGVASIYWRTRAQLTR